MHTTNSLQKHKLLSDHSKYINWGRLMLGRVTNQLGTPHGKGHIFLLLSVLQCHHFFIYLNHKFIQIYLTYVKSSDFNNKIHGNKFLFQFIKHLPKKYQWYIYEMKVTNKKVLLIQHKSLYTLCEKMPHRKAKGMSPTLYGSALGFSF